MRKILVFAIVATMVACSSSPKNENLAELTARRDSLQKEQSSIETQLNIIEAQIAETDTTINPNNLKILKQITMQKNKIVTIEQKIKSLENTMTAKEEKKLLPVAVKEMQNEQFDHYIIAFGEVEAKNYAMISPEMNGRIEKIYVKRGQRV